MAELSQVEMVGFDLETTGLDKTKARIVTMSLTNPQNHHLINPGIEIEKEASATHGITNEIAQKQGVLITDVLNDFIEELVKIINSDNKVLVGFNLVYDLTILEYEAKRNGIVPLSQRVEYPFPVLDAFVIDKAINTFRKGKRTLEVLAQEYDIFIQAHNSLSDAEATIKLIHAILEEASNNPDPRIAQTNFFQLDHVTFSNWVRVWRGKQDRGIWDYYVNQLGRTEIGRAHV